MTEEDVQSNKKHRSGKKRKHREIASSKEKSKNASEKSSTDPKSAASKNPKAFTVKSAQKMRKTFVRKQDIQTKKHHVPISDRTSMSLEPPPIIVAIVGAPKVGKSTLIRCLLKNFTNLKLTSVKGPITVVANKRTRLTFIECNNDICSMIDTAKVADLVLLMIDASFGFEMETFEFLSICQVHGMPRVIGVLTHIDVMKKNKALKNTKKFLKHRFWDEVYQGAKLFYLTNFVNDEYLKREVHNLARFISVMKFRAITWRNNHPYLLVDRMEDLTSSEKIRTNQKCERTVCLYGYARGSPFLPYQDIHVPGCGDFKISDISYLPDPSPLPEVLKKRVLNQKEHLVYSPFSGVGGIVYDKDAVYIELGGSHSHNKDSNETEDPENPNYRFKELMSDKYSLDEKLKYAKMQLFENSQPVMSQVFEEQKSEMLNAEDSLNKESGDDNEESMGSESDIVGFDDENQDFSDNEAKNMGDSNASYGRLRRKMDEKDLDKSDTGSECLRSEDESEGNDDEYQDIPNNSHGEVASDDGANGDSEHFGTDDDNDDDDGALNWKKNLKEKAALRFADRSNNSSRLKHLIYGNQSVYEDEEKEDSGNNTVGNLFTIRNIAHDKGGINAVDVTLPLTENKINHGVQKRKKFLSWMHPSKKESIKNCFITGDFGEEDAEKLLKEDDDAFGDFEDLEQEDSANNDDDDKKDEDEETIEDNIISGETLKEIRRKNYEKKKKRMLQVVDAEGRDKDTFYDELKSEVSAQTLLNQQEFESLDPSLRVQFEGYRAGMYLRIEISGMPAEFVEYFDPEYPIVIGGLGQSENTIGYLNLRVKKHRWFRKILKSKDPVVMSIGWRRFQTVSTYSIQDHNMRNRYLKYTPEFMHCNATVFGPIVPQGTGCLFVENLDRDTPHFRVTASGTVLDLDKSTSIMKKLKLVGYPEKTFQRTAFIKGMFNSALEVSKFIGANIRTVSGIKGHVKKPLPQPHLPGSFRASFEASLVKSDIVFLRTWFPVEIPQFYMPVFNLLHRAGNRESFEYGMKTVGHLRYERGISAPSNPDSAYHYIEKKPIKFKPFNVPASLQKKLPFDVKPKFIKHAKVQKAVIREPHERKLAALINEIRGVHGEKKREEVKKKEARLAERKKTLEKIEIKKLTRTKELRKQLYRTMVKQTKD